MVFSLGNVYIEKFCHHPPLHNRVCWGEMPWGLDAVVGYSRVRVTWLLPEYLWNSMTIFHNPLKFQL